MRLLPLPGDVGLVAARELRERVRGRAFRIGTLLILAVIAAAIVIPAARGDKTNVKRVGVVGALPARCEPPCVADGTAVRRHRQPRRRRPSADGGASRICGAAGSTWPSSTRPRCGDDKAVTADPSAATSQLASAVARTVATANAVPAAGLTPAQAAALAAARSAPVAACSQPARAATQRTRRS